MTLHALLQFTNLWRCLGTILSFLIVAFGQPAWSHLAATLAALFGYALIGIVLLDEPKPLNRFLIAGIWYTAVQLVQLSWFMAHPYAYIYIVYVGMSLILGIQFGIVGSLMTRRRLDSIASIVALASLWVILEWGRLFILSGFSWNPSGLALTGNLFSLQMASLMGIFGLSFWVLFVNLLAMRAWLRKKMSASCLWMAAALFPYLYGYVHLGIHESWLPQQQEEAKNPYFTAVLVQPAFPAEEAFDFGDTKNYVAFVTREWRHVLNITKKHVGQHFDVMALPEFLVPFGTYTFVYPYETVVKAFEEIFGKSSLAFLPPLDLPLAAEFPLEPKGTRWMVNNAFWVQAISNYYNSEVIVGLEDAEDTPNGREFYSAALFFRPQNRLVAAGDEIKFLKPERYVKRVLVPMGEYIPFAFCRELAARYGITGSFTSGQEAKVIPGNAHPLGVCICYEETFGNLTRESRQRGANLLINITSDAWFPNSRLPQQHFDHARLRSVENGIPLLRACNTGVTGALDSFGRLVEKLGNTPHESENLSDSIRVQVPTYHYNTLYSLFGDKLILGFSFIALLGFCFVEFFKPKS